MAIDRERYDAVLFDLDGVITDTASVHRAAWGRVFDRYLADRPETPGEDHRTFSDDDYRRHVDGKPRSDGLRDFLASRGVSVDERTLERLSREKNRHFLDRLEADGVQVFPTTVDLVRRLRSSGFRTAVFTSSRNGGPVLQRAGLADLFDARVDGLVAAELDIPGKPDPAVLLEASRRIGVVPARTVVVEDAQVGVEAGRRGGFGLVVGVDRGGAAETLRGHGADVVVGDLAEVELIAGGRPSSS